MDLMANKNNYEGPLTSIYNKNQFQNSLLKQLFIDNLKHPKLRTPLEEILRTYEKSFQNINNFNNYMIADLLNLLNDKKTTLFKNPIFIFLLLKILIKLLLKSNNRHINNSLQKIELMENIKDLENKLKIAGNKDYLKNFKNSFLAVKSFTFGMSEIMDQETANFQNKIKNFKEQFKNRIIHLEQKFQMKPTTSQKNHHFTNQSFFKPLNLKKNRMEFINKRNFQEFSMNPSIFKMGRPKILPFKLKSSKMDFANMNLLIPNNKPIHSLGKKAKYVNECLIPNTKTSVGFTIKKYDESSEPTQFPIPNKKSESLIKQPVNFEHKEPKFPKEILLKTNIKKNSSCFIIKDRKQWSTKKAFFCWDNSKNLQTVVSDLVFHLSSLFGNLISPQELIIKNIRIKAFTKSITKPNLLAVKIDISSRYKTLVEESWKEGSPSEYFKFKIDLLKKNTIRFWDEGSQRDRSISIKNLFKSPARYNFSQANHYYKSDTLNKKNLNMLIFQKLGRT